MGKGKDKDKDKDKKRKREEKKERKGDDKSESSTPQSSEPSVDDDAQPLLRSGAGTSSRPSPSRNLGASSRNPREQDHLAVPDQESSSPLKKARYNTASNCNCKGKMSHKAECPARRSHPVETKPETPKGKSKKGKAPVSTKNDFSQSSSSSDPSVRSDTRVDQSRDGSHLAVPNPESSKVPSPLKRLKAVFKKKKRSSESDKSYEENTDPDSECSERTKQAAHSKGKSLNSKLTKGSQIKSETSSSSTSPSISKKNEDGHASSSSSRRSNSKSSSASDANVVDCSSPKISSSIPSSRTPPGNRMDLDPQEGTSSGPRSEHEGNSALERFEMFVSQNVISGGESGDESPARRRSRSFGLRRRWRRRNAERGAVGGSPPRVEGMTSLVASFRRLTLRPRFRNLVRIRWPWLERTLRRRPDSNLPDPVEHNLLRRLEVRRHQPVERDRSLSPGHLSRCNCTRPVMDHEISCARYISVRRRRKRRRCRQNV